MPTLNSLLKEYLSKDEIISMIDSYDIKKHDKNNLLLKFHTILCRDIFPLLIGKSEMANVCGSGTVGFVVSLESNNFTFDKFEKQTNIPLYRIRKSKLDIPNKLALKIQIFDTNDKYWEARVLREEFIQNKLSESATFSDIVPKFYFGCTLNIPIDNENIKFRLTFMDLVDKRYTTLLKYLESRHGISDIIYKKVERIVKSLWKYGISHNDLSLNNILISHDDDIKLLDFGLSTMIEKIDGDDINLFNQYLNYFEDKDRSEQNGSNVQKLKELLTYVK